MITLLLHLLYTIIIMSIATINLTVYTKDSLECSLSTDKNTPTCTMLVDDNTSCKNIPLMPDNIENDDEILFDDIDDLEFMNEYLDTAAVDHVSNSIDPKEIMAILLTLSIPDILQLPVFLRSNILHRRSLLDQPIFEPDRASFLKPTVWGLSFFLRKTDRSSFIINSTQLRSYVSLAEELLIEKLQEAFDQVSSQALLKQVNIAHIFSLFENMTVEQRQTGFMLHFTKKFNKTTFRIFAPLYYLENNFYLTKREQDEVARVFGRLTPEEEKEFRKAHFICDKIGMGDTRIEIDQQLIKKPGLNMRCGFQATVPTAFTWGGGFLGSSFFKPSTYPTLDLDPIFDALEGASEVAQTVAENFFLDSLDRLAANLLDIKLGNNRHLGAGAYFRTKVPLRAYMNNSFAEYVSLTNRVSIEVFCPSIEKRFYINKIDTQAFAEHNFSDFDQAAKNLIFLQEQMIERLFLRAFNVKIYPGLIGRWTTNICYSGIRHGFNFGTDFWLQTQDRFSSIQATPETVAQLNKNIVRPPFAAQWKLCGGAVFKHKSAFNTCYTSINGDVTINNKGIGQDWGISLNFEANF